MQVVCRDLVQFNSQTSISAIFDNMEAVIKLLMDTSLGKNILFLTKYTFQLTLHSIWKERNSRRHGEVATSSVLLVRLIDKQVRNKISSVREQGNVRYDGCMVSWFATR
ncbi:hypothetical protein V5N11_009727 [Cardamine amara subsp. amara]|uniref:Uncharacterized protein n=1 Tax=Cardamine amara subsp. amara TaxID=228776 RepID=A0ABD1BQX3_CARAN